MSDYPLPTEERSATLLESLEEIRDRVRQATPATTETPVLVAVSKYKPATDIMGCYNHGHRDFGENYAAELIEKAGLLPSDIRWHFIGTLQSNKAKGLAAIENLHTIQTLTSQKSATILNKSLPNTRTNRLNVMIQINTSNEDSKSGLPPLTSATEASASEAVSLARHIIKECPNLCLSGLMTIGSLSESLNNDSPNHDFETLKQTRDVLEEVLKGDEGTGGSWGSNGSGKLLLSMGMSADFEAALKAGSDIIRVGTGIFGERQKKT